MTAAVEIPRVRDPPSADITGTPVAMAAGSNAFILNSAAAIGDSSSAKKRQRQDFPPLQPVMDGESISFRDKLMKNNATYCGF